MEVLDGWGIRDEASAPKLDTMVRYASTWLADEFDVDPAELSYPEVMFSSRGWFQSEPHYLGLPADGTHPSSFIDEEVLGEEVAHFLHHSVNPSPYDAYDEDLEAANLCELIGKLGGKLFAWNLHPRLQGAQKELWNRRARFQKACEEHCFPEVPEEGTELDYEQHEGGYRAADTLFLFYDTGELGKLARMEVPEVKEVLNEKGHPSPLVVPYSETDQYTVLDEDAEELEVLQINEF